MGRSILPTRLARQRFAPLSRLRERGDHNGSGEAPLAFPGRFHRPGRAFEETYYTFDILADLGAYRDLQRHRVLTQERQRFGVHLGYVTPPELEAAGLAGSYAAALEGAAEVAEAIGAELPDAAQYAVPLAFRVRWRITLNLRGSALRIDTMTPLAPDRVLIEFRGLGLRRDSREQRYLRVRDHNTIWGPFGRNLPEDLLGVVNQGLGMPKSSESLHVLHGRHEGNSIHDEAGVRAYYAEWSRRMGRDARQPELKQARPIKLPQLTGLEAKQL